MVEKQKLLEGEALVSTVLFDHESMVICDRMPLSKVPEMTEEEYFVRGCTALLDAVGGAIHHIGNVHKYAREEDRPEKTVFVITTDGMENASHRYSADEVRRKIRRQEEKYGWEFLFLAANIDAAETARRIGIRRERSANYRYDKDGTGKLYECMSEVVSSVRCSAPIAPDWKKTLDCEENGDE